MRTYPSDRVTDNRLTWLQRYTQHTGAKRTFSNLTEQRDQRPKGVLAFFKPRSSDPRWAPPSLTHELTPLGEFYLGSPTDHNPQR